MKCVLQLLVTVVVTVTLILPASANATVITPQLGGGSVVAPVAPMIMPRITLEGTQVGVMHPDIDNVEWPKEIDGWTVPTGYSMPIMRPLAAGEELSTTVAPTIIQAAYDALNGKAWNWQYGWGNTAFSQGSLLAGTKIWIKLLEQSDGIMTYYRVKGNTPFTPIFGTDGTPNIWQWPEGATMSHNAYTVEPGIADWYAKYEVYLGYMNAPGHVNGDPVPGYDSTTAVFKWTSIPEPATLVLLGTGFICLLRKKAKIA